MKSHKIKFHSIKWKTWKITQWHVFIKLTEEGGGFNVKISPPFHLQPSLFFDFLINVEEPIILIKVWSAHTHTNSQITVISSFNIYMTPQIITKLHSPSLPPSPPRKDVKNIMLIMNNKTHEHTSYKLK